MKRLSICGFFGIFLLAPFVAQAAPPTLDALSQRGGGGDEEVLSYDLTQDFVANGGYLPSTAGVLNTDGLGPSLISTAVNGGGTATPVPEPSTYALGLIGFLGLAALRGLRLRLTA